MGLLSGSTVSFYYSASMGKQDEAALGKEVIEMRGKVQELLPSASFRVLLENNHEVLAYLAGRMRMHKIRLLPGDEVKVELTPYDVTRGRIVYRY